MYATRRVRVEMDAPSYEALRYFSLLRGVPVGTIIRKALFSYADGVSEEFPAVRAHVLAWIQAHEAQAADETDLDMIPY